MRITFLLILSIITSLCYAQKQIDLDNNITANYTQSDNKSDITINYTGENTFKKDSLSVDSNTNYSYLSGEQNEFSQRFTLSYKHNINHFFVAYQFNYSYLRQIKSDNWIGAGYGIKNTVDSLSYGISYASIYQRVDYYDKESFYQIRHSLRFKLKYSSDTISTSTEMFYQPSYFNIKNYVIYGTTKIVLLPQNKLSFVIQDNISYNSYDDIRLIHNVLFGLQYKFTKKYSYINDEY